MAPLPEPNLPGDKCVWGGDAAMPTLHGSEVADGRTQIALPGGVCVELVGEAFSPYRATVRVGGCS